MVLAAYLAVSILGMFTFVTLGSLEFNHFGKGSPGASFAPIDHAADCLALTPASLEKNRDACSSPRGFPRLLFLPPSCHAGAEGSFSAVRAAASVPYPAIKNTILLKLRI